MTSAKARIVEDAGAGAATADPVALLRYADEWLQRRLGRAPRPAPDGDRLRRMIESEVIPRLMLAHRTEPTVVQRSNSVVSDEDVAELARLTLIHEVDVLREFVAAVQERGRPLEQIYVELLAPAAQRIGRLWEEDRADFSTVTIALSRLHRLLLDVSLDDPSFYGAPDDAERNWGLARAVVVSPFPGDQHDFGALMVGEMFRRRGWFVVDARPDRTDELLDTIKATSPDALCLSICCERSAGEIAAVLDAARDAATGSLAVVVGGRAIDVDAGLAEACGADASAVAPLEAVALVERMLEASASLYKTS